MSEIQTHPTALHRLLAEMEALSPEMIAAAEPQEKRARSEEEIGLLPLPLQALFALVNGKVDQHNELSRKHRAMHEAETEETPRDQAEHQRLHQETKALSDDIEALQTLLWRSIYEQFSVDPKAGGVGIRAGWKVVDMYGNGTELGGILGLLLGGWRDRRRPN